MKEINKIRLQKELDEFVVKTLDSLLLNLNQKLTNAIDWTKKELPKMIPRIKNMTIDYALFNVKIDNKTEERTDCDCQKNGTITLYKKPLFNNLRLYYAYLCHNKKPFIKKIDIESIFVHEIVEHIEIYSLGTWQKIAHNDAKYVESINRKMRKIKDYSLKDLSGFFEIKI